MSEKEIGLIDHYYGHINVGIIKLADSLNVGDTIHILGHSSDFTQTVDSMQIEHKNVTSAEKGDYVGIKLSQKVHPGCKIFKVN